MHINFLSNFEMFSLEHFLTLGVILIITITLFVTRKFFIKYKAADMIFRYFLAFLIMFSEIWLRKNPSTPVYAWNMPIPLCGHLLWIAGLALIANSERIYRKIYPLCLVGALLSMIVVDGIPHFPEFRAFQYFFVHGGFFIGALYFVFTRKINKFDFKDFGWSVLLLGGMGALMGLFHMLGVRDDYMTFVPVGPLQGVKDTLGQVGYTLVFVIVIVSLMAIFTLLTWLATKNRKDEDANIPTFKNNKFLTWSSENYSKTARWITVSSLIIAFSLLLVLQFKCATAPEGTLDRMMAIPLAWILVGVNSLAFIVIIFNEILFNYEKKLEY